MTTATASFDRDSIAGDSAHADAVVGAPQPVEGTAPPAPGASPSDQQYPPLQRALAYFNEVLFGGELRACLVTLSRRRRVRGFYRPAAFLNRTTGEALDEIGLHPGFFTGRSIEEILSSLVHEQCHQYVLLRDPSATPSYHSRAWVAKMQEVGLQPSSTGQPGGEEIGWMIDHYILADGKFMAACRELLKEPFVLPWMDRVPECLAVDTGTGEVREAPRQRAVEPEPAPAPQEAPESGVETSSAEPQELGEAQAEGAPALDADPKAPSRRKKEPPMPAAGAVFQPARQSAEVLQELGVAFAAPAPTRRSGRKVAYQCPSKHLTVWGKPGIVVLCGECQSTLVSRETPTDDTHSSPDEDGED